VLHDLGAEAAVLAEVRSECPLDEALDGEARRAAGSRPAVGLECVFDVVLVADVDFRLALAGNSDIGENVRE
jgi:hypothetical protein